MAMKKYFFVYILFIFLHENVFSNNNFYLNKDSLKKTNGLDTLYVENLKKWLSLRMVVITRDNQFSITDRVSFHQLKYSINSNTNMGIGASYRGLALEVLYKPPGLNRDNLLYGKSRQFSVALKVNTRKFIGDVFFIHNKGFYTTTKYNFTGDSTQLPDHVRRPDIANYSGGFNILYVFNHKKFSSAAPYSLTQRQKKSAGSFLLGTYSLIYSLTADSLIYPDTLAQNFKPEVQFKNASSFTWGIAVGYTYTLVFGINWFVNLAMVPGISLQELTTESGIDGRIYDNFDVGISLHSKFSFGYNKKRYFIGVSASNNSYFISGSPDSRLNYRFAYFRFYYGHRFEIKKKK